MKKSKKLLFITTVLIVLLAGIYGGLREWIGAAPNIVSTNNELIDINISDLMASMNILQLTETKESPDFTLMSLAGEQVQLSQYRDKVVLISFWATW